MRWQPEVDPCHECDFSWRISAEEAKSVVATSPPRVKAIMEGAKDATRRPAPGVWSPNGYVWHLVDVLRIGSDRLLTSLMDPGAGITGWDENALAEIRHYESLSPRVGVIAYEEAVRNWIAVAGMIDGSSSVEHPEFGTLTAEDILRRNAHEVQHHELDIRKGLGRRSS
jgi:hypothetical protein